VMQVQNLHSSLLHAYQSQFFKMGCKQSRHIGPPPGSRIGDFNSWNFCYAQINICTIQQKLGHNT
jgi:hypothetical protein